MSFRSALDVSGEVCDKCGKPMNPENPGVYLYANSREAPRQQVWIHIDELQKAIRKAEKEAIHV